MGFHLYITLFNFKSCLYILETFQVVLVVKDRPANARDIGHTGLISRSGRSPGGRNGNPLQYSCLENLHGQRSLMGCSPWDQKESDTTERLSTYTHPHTPTPTHPHTHTHTHTHREVSLDIRDVARSLGWKDPLEKEMATCSRIHVWRTPRTEEPVHSPQGCTELDMTEAT